MDHLSVHHAPGGNVYNGFPDGKPALKIYFGVEGGPAVEMLIPAEDFDMQGAGMLARNYLLPAITRLQNERKVDKN